MFSEGEDFIVLSESVQTFPSGFDSGTLNFTTMALLDEVIESPEVYRVLLSSPDPNVTITSDVVQITIGDANLSQFMLLNFHRVLIRIPDAN